MIDSSLGWLYIGQAWGKVEPLRGAERPIRAIIQIAEAMLSRRFGVAV
jgi:hypothetical protein